MRILSLFAASLLSMTVMAQGKFPDGTAIPKWFSETEVVDIDQLGERHIITDYGAVNDSTILQTEKIQAAIDKAAEKGGVVVIPAGTYLSGSLFIKPKTHLYLEEGATLKGSDDISDFPLLPTRMEGQNLNYFAALIHVDGVDGFTLSGKGTVNGNGLRYWKSFWLRRAYNRQCTNLEELRPRLLYVTKSNDVQISGLRLMNSPFWTTHFYQCNRVKMLNLHISSPASPVKAPSTDAIDIDVCTDFLVKGCYMSVNDDAVALKGGKGPWADKDENNGGNYNIIIEDCVYGYCHGALTCGSESIHNRNVIVRRCEVKKADRLLWLKMRPDTPQNYEHILVEDIKGDATNLLYIQPWTQFFDMKGREDMPLSYGSNITLRNIDLKCKTFFNVKADEAQYILTDFTFENLNVVAEKPAFDKGAIRNSTWKKVKVTQAEK